MRIISFIMLTTLAFGSAASASAANIIEEAWYNTRAENVPHEWAIAEREAKAGNQFASSGAIQTDASNQKKTSDALFPRRDWTYFH